MRWNRRELRESWRPEKLSHRLFAAALLVLLLVTTVTAFRPRATAILPNPRPLHGAQPYATILCKFRGTAQADVDAWPVSYYDRLMTGEQNSVDNFWRQVSYGAISLTGSKAFGWFPMAKPASAYNRPDLGRADLDALARDCTAAADAAPGQSLHFPDYVGINMVFSECVDRPRGGAMDLRLDGRTRTYRLTWLCLGYSSSHQIVAHEIGHSFGLAHSEDSQGSEYGNSWDLMSNAAYCAATTDLGVLAQDPIAYDKDLLGWISPGDKYVARRSGVVTIQLDDLERSPSSSAGYALAMIPLSGGRFYSVEARSRAGYDAGLPASGVLIHEIDPRRENHARLIQGQPAMGAGALLSTAGGWPVGSTFIDPENNVGITVDKQVDAGFIVTLYTGSLPWPSPSAELAAGVERTVALRWQATPGEHQYEVQLSRLVDSVGSPEWGATFVSDRPSIDAPLAPGRYRWQVRALPAGAWSPPQSTFVVARDLAWRPAEQVAQIAGRLRVTPVVSAQANGQVEIAWAHDEQRRSVAVTRASWQGDAWAVQDLFDLPSASRRGLALSFTPAGELKVAWPAAAVSDTLGISSPSVALDAGGRAHTIWAATGKGVRGIFSAIIDAHAPSAGPIAGPTTTVQPVPVADGGPASAKYSPTLALDGSGHAQAIWIDTRDGHSAVYGAEQQPGGSWGPSQRLSDADRAVFGRPAIAVRSNGHAYATWQTSMDCGGPVAVVEVTFAERPAGGEWRPATALIVASQEVRLVDPVVAANDAGEVYVAWGELKGSGYRLYSAYRDSAGQWEFPRLVTEGRTDAGTMNLSLATGPRGAAYLTWVETQATQAIVRFAETQ